MTSGGPRNRSGPKPTDSSFNAAKKGLEFDTLPADGFKGEPPEFPLPGASQRELDVWERVWKTPQAVAWIGEPWRWGSIAMYARWYVKAEAEEVAAAVLGQVHRLADQIGLTPAGLKENGWKVGSVIAEQSATGTNGAGRASSRTRLKVVGNDR